ncbi:MAG TPA: hypothetical protein O0X18_08340, partial [Methanocorpusculum sp.]|nr:hypothetical protein [Methanocorpusculum sp.]
FRGACRRSLQEEGFMRFFPVVRRAVVQDAPPLLLAAVSAGVRCGIRASEALFVRERENLLGTSASVRVCVPPERYAGSCNDVPRVFCGVSRLMIDSMLPVIFESTQEVVAGGDHLQRLRGYFSARLGRGRK